LKAMELSAHILAALVPRALVVRDRDGLCSVLSTGMIPILVPSLIWDEIESSGADALPMSWDTTSDSIAARIAMHIGADRLIMLKSAPLPEGAVSREAAALGLVDPIFPVVARSLARVEYVNLREDVISHQLLPP
jgi:5-(aminomethyl)-3-furanmethanol phosphate kinase